MKLSIRTSTTTKLSFLAAIGVLFVVGIFGFNTSGRSVSAQAENGRLVTVHDRGIELTFVTDKNTLREAFAEKDIAVDAKDAVEPSLDEPLVAPDYQVNIYRARPVTVVDGATRTKVVTPYQSAERIAKDAKIILYDEDETVLDRSGDIVGDGAGLQLTIKRATTFTFSLFGKATQVRTQAKTVGDFLKQKDIALTSENRVSVPLSTPISPSATFSVWREGKQTVTVDEAIAFETQTVKDADRELGYKVVQSAGQEGKRTVTYEITIQDGVEVSRAAIASVTIQEPVKQVEVVGSKPAGLQYTGGGTKTEWLAASNIPQESWGYADYMVSRESTWNPNAVNKSSGACGLAQALPCSKLGPNWSDPIVSLNWMNSYVNSRYGGWEGAYNFWQRNHWY